MREILFRGKRIDNGEWVEGYYAKGKYYISKKELHIIFHTDLELFPHSEFSSYEEIVPGTIGQYTGLTDKNGRRIFEGDIVHTKGGCVSGFGAVEFRNGSFGIADKKRKRFYFLDDHSVYRVDGNIHDNPDILGEADRPYPTSNGRWWR